MTARVGLLAVAAIIVEPSPLARQDAEQASPLRGAVAVAPDGWTSQQALAETADSEGEERGSVSLHAHRQTHGLGLHQLQQRSRDSYNDASEVDYGRTHREARGHGQHALHHAQHAPRALDADAGAVGGSLDALLDAEGRATLRSLLDSARRKGLEEGLEGQAEAGYERYEVTLTKAGNLAELLEGEDNKVQVTLPEADAQSEPYKAFGFKVPAAFDGTFTFEAAGQAVTKDSAAYPRTGDVLTLAKSPNDDNIDLKDLVDNAQLVVHRGVKEGAVVPAAVAARARAAAKPKAPALVPRTESKGTAVAAVGGTGAEQDGGAPAEPKCSAIDARNPTTRQLCGRPMRQKEPAACCWSDANLKLGSGSCQWQGQKCTELFQDEDRCSRLNIDEAAACVRQADWPDTETQANQCRALTDKLQEFDLQCIPNMDLQICTASGDVCDTVKATERTAQLRQQGLPVTAETCAKEVLCGVKPVMEDVQGTTEQCQKRTEKMVEAFKSKALSYEDFDKKEAFCRGHESDHLGEGVARLSQSIIPCKYAGRRDGVAWQRKKEDICRYGPGVAGSLDGADTGCEFVANGLAKLTDCAKVTTADPLTVRRAFKIMDLVINHDFYKPLDVNVYWAKIGKHEWQQYVRPDMDSWESSRLTVIETIPQTVLVLEGGRLLTKGETITHVNGQPADREALEKSGLDRFQQSPGSTFTFTLLGQTLELPASFHVAFNDLIVERMKDVYTTAEMNGAKLHERVRKFIAHAQYEMQPEDISRFKTTETLLVKCMAGGVPFPVQIDEAQGWSKGKGKGTVSLPKAYQYSDVLQEAWKAAALANNEEGLRQLQKWTREATCEPFVRGSVKADFNRCSWAVFETLWGLPDEEFSSIEPFTHQTLCEYRSKTTLMSQLQLAALAGPVAGVVRPLETLAKRCNVAKLLIDECEVHPLVEQARRDLHPGTSLQPLPSTSVLSQAVRYENDHGEVLSNILGQQSIYEMVGQEVLNHSCVHCLRQQCSMLNFIEYTLLETYMTRRQSEQLVASLPPNSLVTLARTMQHDLFTPVCPPGRKATARTLVHAVDGPSSVVAGAPPPGSDSLTSQAGYFDINSCKEEDGKDGVRESMLTQVLQRILRAPYHQGVLADLLSVEAMQEDDPRFDRLMQVNKEANKEGTSGAGGAKLTGEEEDDAIRHQILTGTRQSRITARLFWRIVSLQSLKPLEDSVATWAVDLGHTFSLGMRFFNALPTELSDGFDLGLQTDFVLSLEGLVLSLSKSHEPIKRSDAADPKKRKIIERTDPNKTPQVFDVHFRAQDSFPLVVEKALKIEKGLEVCYRTEKVCSGRSVDELLQAIFRLAAAVRVFGAGNDQVVNTLAANKATSAASQLIPILFAENPRIDGTTVSVPKGLINLEFTTIGVLCTSYAGALLYLIWMRRRYPGHFTHDELCARTPDMGNFVTAAQAFFCTLASIPPGTKLEDMREAFSGFPALATCITFATGATLVVQELDFLWSLLLFAWFGAGVAAAWQTLETDEWRKMRLKDETGGEPDEPQLPPGVSTGLTDSETVALKWQLQTYEKNKEAVLNKDYFLVYAMVVLLCVTISHVTPLAEIRYSYYRVAVGSEMWMSLVKSYPWLAIGGMSLCLNVVGGWLVVASRGYLMLYASLHRRYALMRVFEGDYPQEILNFDPMHANEHTAGHARRWIRDRADLVYRCQAGWRYGKQTISWAVFVIVSCSGGIFFHTWCMMRQFPAQASMAEARSQLRFGVSATFQDQLAGASSYFGYEIYRTTLAAVCILGILPLTCLLVLGAIANDTVLRHWRMYRHQVASLVTFPDDSKRQVLDKLHDQMVLMYTSGRGDMHESLRICGFVVSTGHLKFLAFLAIMLLLFPYVRSVLTSEGLEYDRQVPDRSEGFERLPA